MKTTDFRIGNLLIDAKGRLCEVYALSQFEKIEASAIKGGITSLPVNPIEITEEWILKFGFKIKKTPKVIEYSTLETARFFNLYRMVGYEVFFISQYSEIDKSILNTTQIKTIHQLQNLYFALVEKELTLELE